MSSGLSRGLDFFSKRVFYTELKSVERGHLILRKKTPVDEVPALVNRTRLKVRLYNTRLLTHRTRDNLIEHFTLSDQLETSY